VIKEYVTRGVTTLSLKKNLVLRFREREVPRFREVEAVQGRKERIR
jgi:hypothetical protein